MNRLMMHGNPRILCLLALGSILGACVGVAPPEVNVPIDLSVFGADRSFVVRGTAAIVDNGGPCAVWIAENGVTYHLFQNPRLENVIFDRIVEPGTVSRLILVVRDDLELACAFGRTADVLEVLEIVE